MRDRHKLIRLAVTNGVYDLDTIHSLYDDTQNTYDKGGPIGRKLIKDINERSDADFVKRLQDRNRKYIVNPDNTIATHKLSWATDNQGNAIVYPEVQNTPAGLVDYSNNTWNAFDRAVENGDTLMMSPRQADWFTRNYKKYYPEFNKYDIGGNLPTDHNRLPIDTNPIIDRIRVERLAKYTAPDSALAQIKELTNNIRENEFRREFAEWINPTRNTNDYVDIRKTIPVAEARPTFIKTYKDGGNTGNLPYDWTKAWKKESNKQTDYKHIGKYNVTTTDGNSMVTVPRNVDNINTELTLNSNNYTPDMSWYKDPLTNTKMVTEMPIEPLYGFKDPVFMAALGTGALAKGALTPVTHIIKEGIKPTLTVMSKPLTSITKVFGNTVNPFLATKMIKGASLGDLIINNALTLNGINNAFSNNGLEKTYNHIKKGEYYSGIKSGLGDLLDLSGMIGIANSLNKINKVINKNKLGRNILDDLSNELFYLKEPEKLNIYLQEAENNARNKVLKINNYRDYRLMAIPAPLNLNKINKYTNISFPRHFKDYGYKNVLTSQGYNDVGDIKINPMNIGYMIGKNKQSSLPLEGLLGHELDHSYQPYLYTSPTIPDNTIHYWSANPQSPDYNIWKVLDKNKKTHSWASSPDEVLSEMTNWKILKNEYQIPYKEIQNKQYYINNISRRFHISKEQAKDLLQKASEKGYF